MEQLDKEDRARVRRVARRRAFEADELISRQGDLGDHVMIVDSGLVKVTVTSPSGSEAILGLYGRGELLGEFSALRGGNRSASVVGHLPGSMLLIAARSFTALLSDRTALLSAVLSTSARRLRQADHHRLSFAADDVRTRVATTLLAWAREYGRRVEPGIEIGLRASRRELAQTVAASEKTVDDVLTLMRRAGIIHTGRRRLVILDETSLERLAERK